MIRDPQYSAPFSSPMCAAISTQRIFCLARSSNCSATAFQINPPLSIISAVCFLRPQKLPVILAQFPAARKLCPISGQFSASSRHATSNSHPASPPATGTTVFHSGGGQRWLARFSASRCYVSLLPGNPAQCEREIPRHSHPQIILMPPARTRSPRPPAQCTLNDARCETKNAIHTPRRFFDDASSNVADDFLETAASCSVAAANGSPPDLAANFQANGFRRGERLRQPVFAGESVRLSSMPFQNRLRFSRRSRRFRHLPPGGPASFLNRITAELFCSAPGLCLGPYSWKSPASRSTTRRN